MERIVLGFAKDEVQQKLQRMLGGSGYEIVAGCHSGAELIRTVRHRGDCIVIMGFKLPDATAEEIMEDLPEGCPMISLIRPDQQALISNCDIVLMPLPVNNVQLISTIDMLTGRARKKKKPKPERSEEDQRLITQAKQVLIEKYMMTEEQAHRFIQKRSMDSGSKFTDTAKYILSELGVF